MDMQAHLKSQGFVRHTIDIRERDSFDLWCRTLGVTRHQLTSAVSTVGTNPDLVRRHLKCGHG